MGFSKRNQGRIMGAFRAQMAAHIGHGGSETPALNRFPLPGEWVEWVEPYGKGSEAVHMRMPYEEVAAQRRRDEPRYTSDQQAVDDFCVVRWARAVPRAPVEPSQPEAHKSCAHYMAAFFNANGRRPTAREAYRAASTPPAFAAPGAST